MKLLHEKITNEIVFYYVFDDKELMSNNRFDNTILIHSVSIYGVPA